MIAHSYDLLFQFLYKKLEVLYNREEVLLSSFYSWEDKSAFYKGKQETEPGGISTPTICYCLNYFMQQYQCQCQVLLRWVWFVGLKQQIEAYSIFFGWKRGRSTQWKQQVSSSSTPRHISAYISKSNGEKSLCLKIDLKRKNNLENWSTVWTVTLKSIFMHLWESSLVTLVFSILSISFAFVLSPLLTAATYLWH